MEAGDPQAPALAIRAAGVVCADTANSMFEFGTIAGLGPGAFPPSAWLLPDGSTLPPGDFQA